MPSITSKMKEKEYIQPGSCAVGVLSVQDSNSSDESSPGPPSTPLLTSATQATNFKSHQQLDHETNADVNVEYEVQRSIEGNDDGISAGPHDLYAPQWLQPGFAREDALSPESLHHPTSPSSHKLDWNPACEALRPRLWDPERGSEYNICPPTCPHGRVVEEVPRYTRANISIDAVAAPAAAHLPPARSVFEAATAFDTITGEVINMPKPHSTCTTYTLFGIDNSSSTTLGKQKESVKPKIASILAFIVCTLMMAGITALVLTDKLHIAAGAVIVFLIGGAAGMSFIHVLWAFGCEKRWVPAKSSHRNATSIV